MLFFCYLILYAIVVAFLVGWFFVLYCRVFQILVTVVLDVLGVLISFVLISLLLFDLEFVFLFYSDLFGKIISKYQTCLNFCSYDVKDAILSLKSDFVRHIKIESFEGKFERQISCPSFRLKLKNFVVLHFFILKISMWAYNSMVNNIVGSKYIFVENNKIETLFSN